MGLDRKKFSAKKRRKFRSTASEFERSDTLSNRYVGGERFLLVFRG